MVAWCSTAMASRNSRLDSAWAAPIAVVFASKRCSRATIDSQRLRISSVRPATAPSRAVLIGALALTGVTMRVGATSIGPVLHDLQRDLDVSSGVAGVITTLPVLCFAAMGAGTPRIARRLGPHRTLTGALAISAAGGRSRRDGR